MSFQTELAELMEKYNARIYIVEESVQSLKVEFSYTDEPGSEYKYLTVEDVDCQELKIF